MLLEVLPMTFKQEKEIKIQIEKEEVKLSLFADGMILYIENPKGSPKKLLELINEFTKIAGYKITYRNQLCFYTLIIHNELSQKLRKQSH